MEIKIMREQRKIMKENVLIKLGHKGAKSKERRLFAGNSNIIIIYPFSTFEGKNFLTTSSVVTTATD